VTLPSLTIPFVKVSACGNDFLLIEGANLPGNIDRFALTRQICDRHAGVGADGVEWMYPHGSADVEIQLINADGSEAEISGNGTRCVAAYVCVTRGKEKTKIQTGAGLKSCTLTSRHESEYEFEIGMGKALVGAEFELNLAERKVRGIPVSMGNPHCVIFVPGFEESWREQAAEIQRNAAFEKAGVNVEFVIADGTHDVRVRFFERGVGETQSSGTGSCASAVAAIAAGRAESPVLVHAEGGMQTVRQEDGQVFLRGSAKLVCRGEFFLV
jgi:diaminopimelate epimerase